MLVLERNFFELQDQVTESVVGAIAGGTRVTHRSVILCSVPLRQHGLEAAHVLQ
jgi:hypothetical protein